MFPSFLLFSIGWLFLACNEYVLKNPSPWHKCPAYRDLLRGFTLNDMPPVTIEPNQNLAEIEAYKKEQEERKARRQKELQQEQQSDIALQEELGEELGEAEAEVEDIITTVEGRFKELNVNPLDNVDPLNNVNPLKPVLYPIQLQLHKAVIGMRISRSILLWEESYYAFWIATVSFVVSVAVIWIPWGLLFCWLFRISVWLFLGPWMAIVDRIYFRAKPDMIDADENVEVKDEDAEVKAHLKSTDMEVPVSSTSYFFVLKDRAMKLKDTTHFVLGLMFGRFRFVLDLFADMALLIRYMKCFSTGSGYHVLRERAVKDKDMKRYMYGKFLLRVPRFDEDLFADEPLPESRACPHDPLTAGPISITRRKYGQALIGDMIPQRDIQAAQATKASSQSAKKKRFWEKNPQLDKEKIPLLGDSNDPNGNFYDTVTTDAAADDKKID